MGCARWWSHVAKELGQSLVTEVSMEHWSDLPKDPWCDEEEEWDPNYDMDPPDFDSDGNIP